MQDTEELSNMFYTYMYILAGIPFYVGKGKENRAWGHLHIYKNDPFHNKLHFLLRNKIRFEIKIVQRFTLEIDALIHEQSLIEEYGREIDGTGPLLNLTLGGDGTSGYRLSEETKAKISKAHKGQKNPELSERMRGNTFAVGNKSRTGLRRPEVSIPILAFRSGKLYRWYCCIHDAEKIGGFSRRAIRFVLSGRHKTAYGLTWMLESDYIEKLSMGDLLEASPRVT